MKRVIFIFALLVLILIFVFILCSNGIEGPDYLETEYASGNYFLYKTDDTARYLQFLDKFDYKEYEIVNISYSTRNRVDEAGKNEDYLVTYRYK